jgi:spermidine synthase
MAALLLTAVFLSGFAGLSWEILWQIESALALGVSARGTALTLVATMGGMSLGSALMGRRLRRRPMLHPARAYALLELLVALSGVVLLPGFRAVERLDATLWRLSSSLGPVLHLIAILLVLGPPTVAMGATLPVFGDLARRRALSIATLYALNTAGATVGTLAASFLVLPAAGISGCASLMISIDLLVAAAMWLFAKRLGDEVPSSRPEGPAQAAAPARSIDLLLAGVTGLCTFALEVAWFRSLRATFQSTSESFALMLASVLGPLALGAALAPAVVRRFDRNAVPFLLGAAGVLVLGLSPVIERLDAWLPLAGHGYLALTGLRLGASLALLGPPVLLLGICLPLWLARSPDPWSQGKLYAINTAGAIVGSLAAAWLLLPTAGSTATSWLVGVGLAACACWLTRKRARFVLAGLALLALVFAVLGRSGVGRLRVQSQTVDQRHRVLATHQGPDATVSAIEVPGGDRILVIDGFETTAETATAHYMAWMGRLPMLLHPDPRSALVICFGTGQTAEAVVDEGAKSLDVVELDPSVLALAPLFRSNRGVLGRPGVSTIVMDGRAWLRRTERRYDVVTLEPMSPEFAGTNALYSVELYRHMTSVLNPGAVVAQWVPFHIVPPSASVAIVAAFAQIFPDALLWVDPRDGTGIVIGRQAGAAMPLGRAWPGLSRRASHRDLSSAEILAGTWLHGAALAHYVALGEPVDDDNQALAYGRLLLHRLSFGNRMVEANHALLRKTAMAQVGPAADHR